VLFDVRVGFHRRMKLGILPTHRALGTDVEPEIDLRKRTNRDCHGRGTIRRVARFLISLA
jgi:hypothetical protein